MREGKRSRRVEGGIPPVGKYKRDRARTLTRLVVQPPLGLTGSERPGNWSRSSCGAGRQGAGMR